MPKVNKVKLLSERTSGVSPVIFLQLSRLIQSSYVFQAVCRFAWSAQICADSQTRPFPSLHNLQRRQGAALTTPCVSLGIQRVWANPVESRVLEWTLLAGSSSIWLLCANPSKTLPSAAQGACNAYYRFASACVLSLPHPSGHISFWSCMPAFTFCPLPIAFAHCSFIVCL